MQMALTRTLCTVPGIIRAVEKTLSFLMHKMFPKLDELVGRREMHRTPSHQLTPPPFAESNASPLAATERLRQAACSPYGAVCCGTHVVARRGSQLSFHCLQELPLLGIDVDADRPPLPPLDDEKKLPQSVRIAVTAVSGGWDEDGYMLLAVFRRGAGVGQPATRQHRSQARA